MKGRILKKPEDRFWRMVNKDGPVPEDHPELGACWLWTGQKDGDGLPCFYLVRWNPARAHRYAYELEVGPIPPKHCAAHRCSVSACVRPSHLKIYTSHNANEAA